MRTATPLPNHDDGRPFTVSSALSEGVGAGRLRGPDLETPFRGVRRRRTPQPGRGEGPARGGRGGGGVRADVGFGFGFGEERLNGHGGRPPDDDLRQILEDCRALALRLRPGEVFCGVTAAVLWGVALPRAFRSRALHVAVRRPGRGSRASGTVGHTLAPEAEVRERRFELPVTDAASTWLALASVLPLNELVAAGDHFVHVPVIRDRAEPLRPFATSEALAARVGAYHGSGSNRARAALPLLVTGAESRPESLLRMLLADAGLPEPRVNLEIFDDAGRIGRFDLVYPEWKVIAEYDGDQHRTDDRQYARDMMRLERTMLARWVVIRVRKFELFGEPRITVRRVETALRGAGWVPAPAEAARAGRPRGAAGGR